MLAVTRYSISHDNTFGLLKPFLVSVLIHSIAFLALIENSPTSIHTSIDSNLSGSISIKLVEKLNTPSNFLKNTSITQQAKISKDAPSDPYNGTLSFDKTLSRSILNSGNTTPLGVDSLNEPPVVRKKAYGCLLEIAEAAWQHQATNKTFKGFNVPNLKCIVDFTGIYEFEWDAYATDEEFQISAIPIETVFSDSECRTLHISNSMNFTASGPLGHECGVGAKD